MRPPLILFALSCLACLAALAGPEATQDLALIAMLLVVASALLFVLPDKADRARPSQQGPKIPWVVIDGSNVLFWDPDGPALATVAQVVRRAEAAGHEPVVWFDANVGYRVGDRWLGPGELSRALTLPRERVFVAEKGQPADPFLLEMALQRDAQVITNDRFRDWMERFPDVTRPGFLVQGRFGVAGLEMALAPPESAAKAA